MIVSNPYVVTAVIFIVIFIAGRWFWHWGEIKSAFLLLVFFLTAIGLRLDDIVKKIAATNERLDRLIEQKVSCMLPPSTEIVLENRPETLSQAGPKVPDEKA